MGTITGGISAEQRRREDELVRRHLRLVGYAVSDMATKVPKHVSRSDLTSAGMEGLAQAARSFDPARGIAFDRYAAQRIKGALLDELRRRDWASRSVRARARKVGAVTDDLTGRLGRLPTDSEVAQAAAMDPDAITSVQADVYRAVVLNYEGLVTGVDSDGDMPAATETPDGVLIERERKAYLLDSVGALPERLRRVVIG